MERMAKPDPVMNQKNMLKYYQRFDSIEKKYGAYFELHKKHKNYNYNELYDKCYHYENNRQLSEMTKKEFGNIYANLKLVYAEEDLINEIIEIYDLVYDNVINQYLNIDGMERLFSENYINFEWEMHMGIDYAGHSMKYYRDHFIHQVRDAYSMDVLLENGYADKIMKVLGNEGNSKISRYVCKYLNLQLERKDEALLPIGTAEKWEAHRKDFYLRNIVFMSSYMCALFHDIGYPEVANMQAGRNILAYIANVYNFGSGHIDFDHIFTVLQNSLLFRVVSPKEIRERIEDENIDHGVVSALMFLLHFYENGAFYGLEPYKKCAIELAGLAIYNHTNTYSFILSGKEAETARYTRNVFTLNPISYLLRICDDLQEWDRIYFEISADANIILCNKCRTPIVRRRTEKKQPNGNYDVYYLCNCNTKDFVESATFSTIFRRGIFPYRRLYNVTVCTELRFAIINGKHVFDLNYDLERLLNIAYINPAYAKYRVKELNQLKKMFVEQDVSEMTYIRYFMSANILLIKAYIVGKYLEQKHSRRLGYYLQKLFDSSLNASTALEDLHKNIEKQAKLIFSKLHKDVEKDPKNKTGNNIPLNDYQNNKDVQSYIEKSFVIYIYLYLTIRLGMKANIEADKTLGDDICEKIEHLWEKFKKEKTESKDSEENKKITFTDDTLYLLKDCCKQATRMYREDDLLSFNYYPQKYFEQFSSDKGIEDYFYRFSHANNYQPINQRNESDGTKNELDAYTDLYLFKYILHNILAPA